LKENKGDRMKQVKLTKKKLKFLGRECLSITVNYTKSDEGKRLCIREFTDGEIDFRLIEGYAGRYSKKIPFKIFSEVEARTAYQNYLKEGEVK
tara:strand:- start:2354 stop:2632 length:279 start_codon:yes stop_codon:yes gene_type:complete